ncbi:MAG: right-handed parallel beta-helix repeat-containing protein [Candidatus Aenigmarchaeota archaeon]|nr:right-handed parallel beta-helix repeat-containing protein [Candidatus Aenigmarchaeota archaeon]
MKGISVFIATIILIAFVIAVAALTAPFVMDLTKSKGAGVEEKGKTAVECGMGALNIESLTSNGNLKVTIENLGQTDLSGLKIVAYNQSGSYTYDATPSSISVGSKLTISSDIPGGTVTKIKVLTNCPTVSDEYDTGLTSTTSTTAATTTIPCGEYINFNTDLDHDITGCTGTILYINASDVTLDCNNYLLNTSGDYGINNTGFNNVTIKDCRIELNVSNPGYGIYFNDNADLGVVENNTLTVDGIGVYLYNSSNNTIKDNTVDTYDVDNSPAIYLRNQSSYNMIYNNDIYTERNNAYGIYLYDLCHWNNITNNYIYTELQSGNGVYLRNSSYNTIHDNDIYMWMWALGVWLRYGSSNNIITNNYIYADGGLNYGIGIRDSSDDSTVVGNTIILEDSFGSNYGIYVPNSVNGLNISDNEITVYDSDGGYGIYLQSLSGSDIVNNTINTTGSSSYGIYLYSSFDNRVSQGSIITEGGKDYYLRDAENNNSFRKTNFTDSRQIEFYDTTSWFNYNNESSGGVWLNTSVNSSATLTRELTSWTQSLVEWNDTATDIKTQYNLSGLYEDTYRIRENGNILGYPFATNGELNFSVNLSGEHQMDVTYWGGCFLAGTKITMADGNGKNIEDIKIDDYVFSYNLGERKYEKAKVTRTFEHGRGLPYYLVINDNLKVTPNHPVYVNGEWKAAGSLKKGDRLFTGKVESIVKVYKKKETYNLEVERNHNYFAEGVLVHNK